MKCIYLLVVFHLVVLFSCKSFAGGITSGDGDQAADDQSGGGNAPSAFSPEGGGAGGGGNGPRYEPIVQQCYKSIMTAYTTCKNSVDAASATANASMASALAKYGGDKGEGFTKKPGILKSFLGGRQAMDTSTAALAGAKKMCISARNPAKEVDVCTETNTECEIIPPTPAELQVDPTLAKQYGDAKTRILKMQNSCHTAFVEASNKLNSDIASAQAGSAQMTAGMKKVLGIGALVVGGAVLYDRHQDKKEHKKERRARAAAEKDFAEGIIKGPDGKKMECYTPENYTKTECQSTVVRLCSGDKKNEQGCVQFSNSYCGAGLGEGANTNYCLARETAKYCAVPATGSEQSPGCAWLNNLSDSCKKEPNNFSCGANLNPEQIANLCSRFINDPVCSKYRSTASETLTSAGDRAEFAQPIAVPAGNGPISDALQNLTYQINQKMLQHNTEVLQIKCREGRIVGCPY